MEGKLIDGPAPPRKEKRRDIITISSPSASQFTILSERVHAIIYHWMGGRSRQCRKFFGDCEGCALGAPEKWSGYLHCQRWPSAEEVFIELSTTAVNQILVLANNRISLRGSVIRMSKTKGGLRGRYVIDMLDRIMPADDLPPFSTPDYLLQKLWAAKQKLP